MPATNPLLIASSGAMPAATPCCASEAAVSGAPSMMLCRMAEKSGSDIEVPGHADWKWVERSVIRVTIDETTREIKVRLSKEWEVWLVATPSAVFRL